MGISVAAWITNVAFLIHGKSFLQAFMYLYLIQIYFTSGITQASSRCTLIWGVRTNLSIAPRLTGSGGGHLHVDQHQKHQTSRHRHAHYRHRLASDHAGWVVRFAPVWRRQIRSGKLAMETGEVMTALLGPCALLFPNVLSACKGVTWLIIATVAEVPPAVSLRFSLYLSYYLCISRPRYFYV